jgi:hypothetical protein
MGWQAVYLVDLYWRDEVPSSEEISFTALRPIHT